MKKNKSQAHLLDETASDSKSGKQRFTCSTLMHKCIFFCFARVCLKKLQKLAHKSQGIAQLLTLIQCLLKSQKKNIENTFPGIQEKNDERDNDF